MHVKHQARNMMKSVEPRLLSGQVNTPLTNLCGSLVVKALGFLLEGCEFGSQIHQADTTGPLSKAHNQQMLICMK